MRVPERPRHRQSNASQRREEEERGRKRRGGPPQTRGDKQERVAYAERMLLRVVCSVYVREAGRDAGACRRCFLTEGGHEAHSEPDKHIDATHAD